MEYLSWQRQGNVAEVILDRPPANALANEVISELDLLLDELENEPNVRVVLIYGKGDFFRGRILRNLQLSKMAKNFLLSLLMGSKCLIALNISPNL